MEDIDTMITGFGVREVNYFDDADQQNEIERKGDLSSFAMLLLEPDGSTTNHHIHSSSPSRRESVLRRKTPINGDAYVTRYIQNSSPSYPNNTRHLSLSIDEAEAIAIQPHILAGYNNTPPSPSSSGSSGFRNLFRKRHKSIGTNFPSSGQGSVPPNWEGSPALPSPAPLTPTSSGGSSFKFRNLFGSIKSKQKSPDASLTAVSPLTYYSDQPTRRHSSLKTRHESIVTDLPIPGRKAFSCYGDVIREGASVPRMLYGNIYQTSQQQTTAGAGGGRHLLMQKRSYSVKDPPVGPEEFVEMFRSRANSENHMSESVKLKLRAQRKMSANNCSWTNSTPDYCPFEPRQVIIWKDSTYGTQIFRLPSNEDEDKMIRESPDEDDTHDWAYHKFLKQHSCYDAIPTSTKLVVLDVFLTVKKAFHALNDNKIHAAPLWDTRKQDFIGLLTITDFIRVLLQCHKTKMSILESSKDQSITYWAEILAGPQGQELLYTTPRESMYNVVLKLLGCKIHRLPIMDEETGNILYIVTLKRILRYLFLFHYSLPHPSFMGQTLSELKIGTFQNLAVVTPDTKLLNALEVMVSRHVSSLPIADSSGKLIGIFSKSLMMGLDSVEAYADLEIPIGKIFNGPTMVSAMTCMKDEVYKNIIERLVNSEVHRLVVVDGDGKVEGIVSCSDVMKHIMTYWEEETASVTQVTSCTSVTSEVSDRS